MKNLKAIYASLAAFFLSTYAIAQEEGGALDINVTTEKLDPSGAFYTQYWFWIIVGLLFIILLVALMRGGNRS